MFMRENSATINGNFWYITLGLTSGRINEYEGKYMDYKPSDFQKALWWYNGAMGAGKMAGPPAYTVKELLRAGQYSIAFLRSIFGMPADEVANGVAQASPTGQIDVPSSFICGRTDQAILCDSRIARTTKEYINAHYMHLVVECDHNLVGCGGKEQQKVWDRIWQRIITTEE